jgi:hypothetical protein
VRPPAIELPRTLMARAVYAWILFVLVYFYAHNSLVHQWHQPPLIYPEADNTYWLLHLLYIPQGIMRSPLAGACFDIVLCGSVLLFLVFPQRVVFCALSITCLWLYEIMYSSANGHHYHHVGLLLLPLPFLLRQPLKFYFSWQLVRYWILFLFVCSGVYKFYYGGFFFEDNMMLILRQHAVPGSGLQNRVVFWLTDHAAWAQRMYQATAFLQVACAIGFFTRKYDIAILCLLLVFNLSNIFILNIPFWDNSLMIAPFLPWAWLQRRQISGRVLS